MGVPPPREKNMTHFVTAKDNSFDPDRGIQITAGQRTMSGQKWDRWMARHFVRSFRADHEFKYFTK